MRTLTIAALAAVPLLLLASPAHAQTDPEATLLVGYSYLRVGMDGDAGGDAHGAEAAYTYYLDRRFGFTVSGAGYWGTIDAPPNVLVVGEFDIRQVTVMAGPTFVVWRGLTSELDLTLLGGAAWRELEAAGFGAQLSSEWEPAFGAHLNLDLRVADHIWVRAAQPGVLLTRFNDDWRADFRISIGLVLRAGEILQ